MPRENLTAYVTNPFGVLAGLNNYAVHKTSALTLRGRSLRVKTSRETRTLWPEIVLRNMCPTSRGLDSHLKTISMGRGDNRMSSATSFGSSLSAGLPPTAATPNPARRFAWRIACDPVSTFIFRTEVEDAAAFMALLGTSDRESHTPCLSCCIWRLPPSWMEAEMSLISQRRYVVPRVSKP